MTDQLSQPEGTDPSGLVANRLSKKAAELLKTEAVEVDKDK